MLDWTEIQRVNQVVQEANQFRSFVGTASVVEPEDDEDEERDVETDSNDRCSVGFVAAMVVFVAVMMG